MDVAIGKKSSGKPYTLDLSKASPVLIEGETGSGKSYLTSLILSNLVKQFDSDEIKFCLLNPTQFAESYEKDSPYLMAPIARSIEEIITLLTFIDNKMRRRYYKNLSEYEKKGYANSPRVVVVFEEFNTLTQTDRQNLEALIIFLAQMAGETGIYIILNTIRMDESDPIRQFINTYITTLREGKLEIKSGKKQDLVNVL